MGFQKIYTWIHLIIDKFSVLTKNAPFNVIVELNREYDCGYKIRGYEKIVHMILFNWWYIIVKLDHEYDYKYKIMGFKKAYT